MAEGMARASAPPGVEVFSAGSRPAAVNPLAIEVMGEIGIDLSAHRSKGLDAVPLQGADAIVTLCTEEECPITPPHVRRISWAMPDPAATTGSAEQARLAFRTTRDEIGRRLTDLWQSMAHE
jgi:arsenate reductase (thioredoxin)